jgi:hypothetical protein
MTASGRYAKFSIALNTLTTCGTTQVTRNSKITTATNDLIGRAEVAGFWTLRWFLPGQVVKSGYSDIGRHRRVRSTPL